ncbi:MAG: ATP-grasp domain-containing protein [Promethearchaeati archaeon SRVP18_Atabeyarchaeia-1]
MSLRVLICEYLTGGGFSESPTFPQVLSEAYAMSNTLLKDFSYNAGCEVATLLDRRLSGAAEPLAAKSVARISSSSEFDRAFSSSLSQVDAALVVAPETNGILLKMTEIAEERGPILLGSSSGAVKLVADKERAAEMAKSLGIRVPAAFATSTDVEEADVHDLARDIGYPVIIKPKDGAGSEGVFVIRDRRDLGMALRNLGEGGSQRRLLIQEYIKGVDASVSVLSTKNGHALPLSLNRQLVELRSPDKQSSTYEGGYTPFDHPLRDKAFDCARRIVEAVKGLRGYVGIDFVLTGEEPVFMEVNARITTSYAGLSRVLVTDGRDGVAPAILDAVRSDGLPSRVGFRGVAYYSKAKLNPHLKVDRDMIDVLSNLEYVESPPFQEQGENKEAFLVNIGKSLDEAMDLKSRNERKLERIAAKLQKG